MLTKVLSTWVVLRGVLCTLDRASVKCSSCSGIAERCSSWNNVILTGDFAIFNGLLTGRIESSKSSCSSSALSLYVLVGETDARWWLETLISTGSW